MSQHFEAFKDFETAYGKRAFSLLVPYMCIIKSKTYTIRVLQFAKFG